MKKILTTVITALLAVSVLLNVCILLAVGKEEKINLSYDESAIVSIYEVVLKQDAGGVVERKDLKLWKTEKVLPTKMIKLPGNSESCWYKTIEGNGEIVDIVEDKVYFVPSGDEMILYRQRQKKDITFYWNGKNIYDKLTQEEKEVFDEQFKNTYEEEFYISSEVLEETIARIVGYDFIKIELFTSPTLSGEPFMSKEMHYSSYYEEYTYYDVNFELIRSTDVYIKITK